MQTALRLAVFDTTLPVGELLRRGVVLGCGLALILAGPALPALGL